MKRWGFSLIWLFWVTASAGAQDLPMRETPDFKDSWLGLDKLKHVTASALIAGSLTWMGRHQWRMSDGEAAACGAGMSFSLGLSKEFYDATFSWKDLVADLMGVLLGLYLLGNW